MTMLRIPVTKGKGHVEIDSDAILEDVFTEAVKLGLKELVNRGMSKITKANIPDETQRQSEAMLKAEENVKGIMAGKIRFSTGAVRKASGAIMTEARRLAKALIKDEMKRAGIKVSHVDAKEITAAANELLSNADMGPQLMKEAEENLEARKKVPVGEKIDIKSLIRINPDKKAKAEAKAKANKAEGLSAKQAAIPTKSKGKGAQAQA